MPTGSALGFARRVCLAWKQGCLAVARAELLVTWPPGAGSGWDCWAAVLLHKYFLMTCPQLPRVSKLPWSLLLPVVWIISWKCLSPYSGRWMGSGVGCQDCTEENRAMAVVRGAFGSLVEMEGVVKPPCFSTSCLPRRLCSLLSLEG